VWRVSWHDGFGHTRTAECENPFEFRHALGHVDWFAVDGWYRKGVLPVALWLIILIVVVCVIIIGAFLRGRL
jgi:hypothetical protein